MEKLSEFFKDKNIKTILDVGTGTGDFVTVLNEIFPDSDLIGVDPNIESLSLAKEKFPEFTFLEMGAERLLFENNEFDLVSISMALHHVPDVKKSLMEIQRVCKTGGWIVINELYSDNLNPAQEVHKIFHHFRSKTDRLLGVSHNETFKKDEIIKMVKDSGIDVILHFENHLNGKIITESNAVEEKIEKIKNMLEKVKHLPEYNLLLPEVERFKESVLKYGFQSPPRVVIIGQ